MNIRKCDVVNDLLPLYAEDMCSEESRKLIAEHLLTCDECKKTLDKMNVKMAINPDTDISSIRNIKKRIRIEKIVIILITFFVAFMISFFAYFDLNKPCSMDYKKYNLSENVWITETENGDLWLCKKDEAVSADSIMPIVFDADGNKIGDDDFDSSLNKTYGVTLQHRKFDDHSAITLGIGCEERSFLFNKNEKTDITSIVYYDDENDVQYKLWERE